MFWLIHTLGENKISKGLVGRVGMYYSE